ncbi:MAG: hypothetical protein E2577_18590 [Starkeya sp.]|nr:hypothetical protein [Starkeya sp.]
MNAWIGPAIVAAVISSLVTIIGWWLNHRHEQNREAARRQERIRDVQTALRAEIRSHRHRLRLFDEATRFDEVEHGPDSRRAEFTPFVPREVNSFVFEAIVKDIPILPTEVIDPVIVYYRQVQALAQFAEDLRGDRFATLEWSRKAAMHADYIAMGKYAGALADAAMDALDVTLARGVFSSSAGGRSVPKSGSAAAPGSGGDLKP